MNTSLAHPIFNSAEFFVETPMAIDLRNQLNAWVQSGATGGAIFGAYRCGKSRAIEFVSDQIYNRLNQKIHTCRLTIHRRTAKTETSIFRNLCLSLRLVPKSRSTTDDMSDLVFHHFCDLALKNDTKQVVLFVDEVHRLTIDQLEAFCEIYDKLVEVKVNISIFFIGNSNTSANLIHLIEKERNELIRGRFFTRRFDFSGVRTANQVRKILSQYDKSHFPTPNGPSYTMHFAGEKCGKDFRLADLTEVIWEVFSDNYRNNLKLREWPMQYFISTIQMLLVDYLPMYGVDNDEQLYNSIYQSVEASELVSSLARIA